MKKRIISALLLCALLTASPILAAPAEEPTEVVEISMPVDVKTDSAASEADAEGLTNAINAAKTLIGETSDYADFNHYSYSYYEDVLVYQLRWSGSKTERPDIEMTVGADGSIYSYYNNMDYWKENVTVPSVTKAGAIDIAYDFALKANPDFAAEISKDCATVRYNRYRYSIEFDRVVKGYSVASNFISVSLDSDGEVYSYSSEQMAENVALPTDPEKASASVIADTFKKNLALVPKYINFYDDETEKYTVRLVYTLPDSYTDYAVDAQSGKLYKIIGDSDYELYGYTPDVSEAAAVATDSANGYVMTEAEQKAVELQNSFKSFEDIIAELNKINGIEPRDYTIESSRVYGDESMYSDKVTYYTQLNLKYTNSETNSEMYAYLTAESVSGKIISYSSYDYEIAYNLVSEMQNDYMAGEKAAKALLKAAYGDIADDYVLVSTAPNDDETANYYYYNYVRTVNGIPFVGDTANVAISPYTLTTASFSLTYSDDAEFAPTAGMITSDTAFNKYNGADMLKPFWAVTSSIDGDSLKMAAIAKSASEKTLTLVYAYENNFYIDAFTGQAITYGGDKYVSEGSDYYKSVYYSDISKSPYHEAIEALTDMDILDYSKRYLPNRFVTVGEYMDILGKFDYVSDFYNEDIDKDVKLTREQAVKYLVQSMGYDEVAKLDIYKCSFADADKISPDCLGSVAIADGFGMLDIYDGTLDPTTVVNRGEMAAILYAYAQYTTSLNAK